MITRDQMNMYRRKAVEIIAGRDGDHTDLLVNANDLLDLITIAENVTPSLFVNPSFPTENRDQPWWKRSQQ